MKKDGIKIMMGLLALALVMTGCAGGKKTKQEINLLKTQVGGLTTEVSRISEDNKFTQEALKEQEEKRAELEDQIAAIQTKSGGRAAGGVSTAAGVYRTPSGFELRATQLQSALKNAGYYNGGVDGKVGPGTTDAIRRFQADNGLDADGVCGRKTWSKLKSFAEGPAVK